MGYKIQNIERNFGRLILVLVFFANQQSVSVANAQDRPDSPRFTPLVKVIREIEPGIVALFTPFQNQIIFGSGTVIHEDGFVLTNNHVLPQAEGFALLPNAKPIRFRVVGRSPESDVAIIQLQDLRFPLPTVALGHSNDLLNGESVVVAGNPGGRGTIYNSGIVSSKAVLEGGANALVMSQYENTRRDKFIQFDAASNGGNSGGPLVNMESKIIGIVSAVFLGEQNAGLAIPIDKVRRLFETMLEPELIHQRSTGLHIDPDSDSARIVGVTEGSAAFDSGLQLGDVIEAVNGKLIRHALDWLLILDAELPVKKKLQLSIRRGTITQSVEIDPRETSPLAPVELSQTAPGLRFSLYPGKYDFLPDFSKLTSERTGIVDGFNLKQVYQTREDYFAVTFDGLLEIEKDGLYRLILVSDDGSRLRIHGQVVIDHDGNHPPKQASRLIRLKKGLYPLRVEYFQGNGDKQLHLFCEHLESREASSLRQLQEVGSDKLTHSVNANCSEVLLP